MHIRTRLAARLALPLAGIGCIAVVACRDNAPSAPMNEQDQWADAAVVGLQVNNEVSFLDEGRVLHTEAASQRIAVPVLRGLAMHGAALRESGGRAKRRTLVKHLRDRAGKVRSIAFRYDRTDQPPNFIYAFENGRIQAIAGFAYRRHGSGYLRTRTRLTLFSPDGTPVAQFNQSSGSTSARIADTPETRTSMTSGDRARPLALPTTFREVARDVTGLFLPREAHASPPLQTSYLQCFDEFLRFLGNVISLAGTATSIQLTVRTMLAPCFAAGAAATPAAGALCLAAAATVGLLLSTMGNYSELMDKLNACIDRVQEFHRQLQEGGDGTMTHDGFYFETLEPDAGSGNSTTGNGTATTWDAGSSYSAGPFVFAVESFINNSINAGDYWCDGSGDYCIYY